jgi:neural Wiskott-Aldrich syndrome protein
VISSPAPHSFVHVSHVGVNTRGIIESSKNIEPAWGALIADLQGYGISPEVLGDNMGFIKEMVSAAGVPNGPNVEVESPVTPQCTFSWLLSYVMGRVGS